MDVDPEETTVLELRMIEQGFEVHVARSAEAALKKLKGGQFEVVVSEIDLGSGDGFSESGIAAAARRPCAARVPSQNKLLGAATGAWGML